MAYRRWQEPLEMDNGRWEMDNGSGLTVVGALVTALIIQVAPAPAPDADLARLVDQYRHGDAAAAVTEMARRFPNASVDFRVLDGSGRLENVAGAMSEALLHTEVGFTLGTFGRYALSAPLMPSENPIGLNGMFE